MKHINLICFLFLTLILAGYALALEQGAAVREIPSTYSPQNPVEVTINFVPLAGTTVWDVIDTFPSGWTPSDVNCFIPATRTYCGTMEFASSPTEVSWVITDGLAQERILSYKVTPPEGTSGTKTFTGIMEDYVGDNYSSSQIKGKSTILLNGSAEINTQTSQNDAPIENTDNKKASDQANAADKNFGEANEINSAKLNLGVDNNLIMIIVVIIIILVILSIRVIMKRNSKRLK